MTFNQLIIKQDESLGCSLTEADFDLSTWSSREDSKPLAGGRGGSQRIKLAGQSYVLRQYLRGGLVSKLLHDSYCWMGLERSRPFVEQKAVIQALHNNLPVPAIAGYRIERTGLCYRAAIISRFIANKGTLASYLYENELSAQQWFELGALIKRFHLACLYHADLNANNILLGEDDGFYLIDFDKAKIMGKIGVWGEANLRRLLRSLDKIRMQREQQSQSFRFTSDNWQMLLKGYK